MVAVHCTYLMLAVAVLASALNTQHQLRKDMHRSRYRPKDLLTDLAKPVVGICFLSAGCFNKLCMPPLCRLSKSGRLSGLAILLKHTGQQLLRFGLIGKTKDMRMHTLAQSTDSSGHCWIASFVLHLEDRSTAWQSGSPSGCCVAFKIASCGQAGAKHVVGDTL